MPFNKLHSAIKSLPDTGPSGFEGFIRDALTELTGQSFRLMKSGPQGGVDSIGDPFGSGLVIGMEGKRYGAKTPLPLDALKSKLRDAAQSFPMMDLWLLATTRSIGGGDTKALVEIGDELGIDVLVFDWSDGGAVPPPLAVISAAVPATVSHHFGPKVRDDITAIRSTPYFAAECERLRNRLCDPSVGLATARQAVRDWAVRQMEDPTSARVAFDSYASLEAPKTIRIARPVAQSSLNAWWESGCQGPAVLLGQEGMGKTWAALSWWLAKSSETPDFPLTLVIPAREVSSIDGFKLVANALHRATGVRDLAFWRRRLERWLAVDTGQPLIMVVFDGLNQNWSFQQWSDLLLSLETAERRGKIATLLTCRPKHWTSKLKELGDARLKITPIDVLKFSDAELDDLLAAHGLSRDDLHPKLIDLMRVPRLSGIAIERRDEVQNWDEITPERLIYEDWRYRYHGAQKAMSHAEFQVFIGELARELSDQLGGSVDRKALFERLSPDGEGERSDLEAVFSELTEGGWLKPAAEAGQFELNEDRIPAALGLALLGDVKTGTSSEHRAEILDRLLDPMQGSDLSVAILKNAATFAFIDENSSDEIKLELLEVWLGAQNFSPIDFESYWRLIGNAPDLFIRIAEDEWFGSSPSKRSDEVLVKGFANALKWPEVASALEAKLLEWFSRYWLDKLEGEISGPVESGEAADTRRQKATERAMFAEKEGVAQAFGIKLQEVDPSGQAWGSYRATELLSWLPRAPLINVFTAWAITRAILGGFRQFDALAWVLRWNTDDPVETETAVLKRVHELLARQGEIALNAAQSLLDALATPAARELHDEHFPMHPTTDEGQMVWPATKSTRIEKHPLQDVLSLRADPEDPEVELSREHLDRLKRLAELVSDSALLRSNADLKHEFGRGVFALAHWAPEALGDLVRRRSNAALAASKAPHLPSWIIRTRKMIAGLVGRGEPRIEIPAVSWLPSSFLVLEESALGLWAALSRRLEAFSVERPYELQLTALAGKPADVQARELRRVTPPAGFAPWVKSMLQPASEQVVEGLAQELDPKKPMESLVMWIQYLRATARHAIPAGWAPLALLISHDDLHVRAETFRLIHRSENGDLANRLEESGWTWTRQMDREEAAYGSLALTLSVAARAGQLADRVHPEVLGTLAELYPEQRVYLDRFADYIRSELNSLNTSKSRAYPRALLNHTDGWELLAEAYGDDIVEWTRPIVEGSGQSLSWFMWEPFPLLHALEISDKIEPGSKAQVVARSLREMASSSFRSGDLYHLATTLAGDVGEESRQLALAEANDDAKLFDFAIGLQASGQTEWLIGQIGRDLEGNTSGLIARGLVLAGFLQPTLENDAFWSSRLAEPPASGWLSNVHRSCRTRYRRYKWSRHWNRRFQDAELNDEAFGAYELFLEALDGRLFSVEDMPSRDALELWDWRRRTHWGLGWDRVKSAAKSVKGKLSKEFLASKPPLSNQSPRRH